MGFLKVNEDQYIATLYSQAFPNKFLTVKIWSMVAFADLNPAWYSPIAGQLNTKFPLKTVFPQG